MAFRIASRSRSPTADRIAVLTCRELTDIGLQVAGLEGAVLGAAASGNGQPPSQRPSRGANRCRGVLVPLKRAAKPGLRATGTYGRKSRSDPRHRPAEERAVNNIIYLVGLVVVIIAVLSFFGLR